MPSPSALLLQLFRLQEEERARVGRALHNQVGQALSAIRMGAHLVQSEDDADLRAEDLHEIIRASDETVAILRDLHARLYPPQLDAIGLDAALRAEVERHFPPGTLSVSLPPLPRAPQADLALVAVRIGPALLRQRDAVDGDRSRIDGLETVDGSAQGRLARAGRAEHHDHLTLADGEGDVVEDVQRPEVLVDRGERDDRRPAGLRRLPRHGSHLPNVAGPPQVGYVRRGPQNYAPGNGFGAPGRRRARVAGHGDARGV